MSVNGHPSNGSAANSSKRMDLVAEAAERLLNSEESTQEQRLTQTFVLTLQVQASKKTLTQVAEHHIGNNHTYAAELYHRTTDEIRSHGDDPFYEAQAEMLKDELLSLTAKGNKQISVIALGAFGMVDDDEE
jgi:hypothetical protein